MTYCISCRKVALLFPFDFAVWLVGSLHSSSQLDISVKGAMIRDLLNMAGYMLPDKDDVVANPASSSDTRYW